MNNEELKKKIMEIIIDAIWKDAEADYDSTDETEAGSIADALIKAGIGDVKEAEHRAVKAERALVMSCANMVKDEKSDVNIEWVIRALYYKYLKQAEKELEEERKND